MKAKALVLQKSIEIDWNDFEESLHDHFGVNAVTLKKNGARRSAGDILWANGLCALIKINPKGARRICDIIQKLLSSLNSIDSLTIKEMKQFITTYVQ